MTLGREVRTEMSRSNPTQRSRELTETNPLTTTLQSSGQYATMTSCCNVIFVADHFYNCNSPKHIYVFEEFPGTVIQSQASLHPE